MKPYTVTPPENIHVVNNSLLQSLRQVRAALPTSGLIFTVNNRKKLLGKVYRGIIQVLGRDRAKTVLELNDIKPGIFTNVHHGSFVEPSMVVMVLTKNHNLREKLLLKELQALHIPYLLIKIDTMCRSKYFSYELMGVRAIYHFLYNMECLDYVGDAGLPKNEFLEKYSFLIKPGAPSL